MYKNQSVKMFSKSTQYALRAVIYLSKYSSEENKVRLEDISKAIDSPTSFTAKIMQQITGRSDFISSITGPNGGFYMSKKSKQLPLIELLKILNEDAVLSNCILGLSECSEENPCPLHEMYRRIKPDIIKMFTQKSLGDLVNDFPDGQIHLKVNQKA